MNKTTTTTITTTAAVIMDCERILDDICGGAVAAAASTPSIVKQRENTNNHNMDDEQDSVSSNSSGEDVTLSVSSDNDDDNNIDHNNDADDHQVRAISNANDLSDQQLLTNSNDKDIADAIEIQEAQQELIRQSLLDLEAKTPKKTSAPMTASIIANREEVMKQEKLDQEIVPPVVQTDHDEAKFFASQSVNNNNNNTLSATTSSSSSLARMSIDNSASLSTENIFSIIKEIEDAVNNCNASSTLRTCKEATAVTRLNRSSSITQTTSTTATTINLIPALPLPHTQPITQPQPQSPKLVHQQLQQQLEVSNRKMSISAISMPNTPTPVHANQTAPAIVLSASTPSLPQSIKTLTTTTTTTTTTTMTTTISTNDILERQNNNNATTSSSMGSLGSSSSGSVGNLNSSTTIKDKQIAGLSDSAYHNTSVSKSSKHRLFKFKIKGRNNITASESLPPLTSEPSTASSPEKKEKKKWSLSLRRKKSKKHPKIPEMEEEEVDDGHQDETTIVLEEPSDMCLESTDIAIPMTTTSPNLIADIPNILSASVPISESPLQFFLDAETNNKGNSFGGGKGILETLAEEDDDAPRGGRGRSNAFYMKGPPVMVNGEIQLPPPITTTTMTTTTTTTLAGSTIPKARIQSFEVKALPKESSNLMSKPVGLLSKFKKSPAKTGAMLRVVRHHSSRFMVGFADTIGRRPHMEDDAVIYGTFRGRSDEDYFALFDGHGGSVTAELAANEMHKVLAEKLKTNSNNPVKSLREAFLGVHQMIGQKNLRGGTTALVVLFLGKKGYVANCGDTRAVLCREGVALRVSNDHKPNDPKEEERIKSLGGSVITTVNSSGISMSRNQFMIIACDGLWDVMTDEEAMNVVSPIDDPEKACMRLRDQAFARGSTDNISVMVIRFPPFDL
ncbi:hypothetical protein SAMD00019534_119850 [Acytostelium subglobosum LB1]|uniref:hypothetical protein n=1 Tax=Acytostelium subglobosum LB1 TaxID=1410327 RepID=UPI00064500A6|nr:hypothetical protein SAMD00019534_119850 [Acytostelium subglobosum LB1]GAM28809.1 hypothetical protein SAMD00019534_119850 [Acytostelium subglobosum LB1]|eukprot:XP_012748181.1 hypothetical protein SAMD00019534_119850 [Acytostelium subglobosum LB1]